MARKTAITEPRHHSARPVSNVAPNPLVNAKPNYQPTEQSAVNVVPSLPGPVGVDPNNSRIYGGKFGAPDPALAVARNGEGTGYCDDENEDPDPEDGLCSEDRLKLS